MIVLEPIPNVPRDDPSAAGVQHHSQQATSDGHQYNVGAPEWEPDALYLILFYQGVTKYSDPKIL